MEQKRSSQVDQGERYPTRYVSNRSFRRTSKCFLSLLLCKDRITKAKAGVIKATVSIFKSAMGWYGTSLTGTAK